MHPAGIDQIPVDLAGAGRRRDPEDTVLAVQHDIAIGGNVIGNQGRQTDAEVYISAVGKVLRGQPSDLATFLKHSRAPFAWRKSPAGIGLAPREASDQNSPPSSGRRGYSDTLKTDGRSQRMRVWPRHPGRAARSIENRECPKPATRDCEQQ